MMSEPTPNFEHAALEADIKRLANEVMRHREQPENLNTNDRELLKRSIKESRPSENAGSPPPSSSPLPQYAKDAPAETKLEIEYLLDLALHEGVQKANNAARNSNPFVVDAFHDALTDKMYPELQRRGLLK